MARYISMLDFKVFSRLCGHDFGFGNIARREYRAVASKVELRGGQVEAAKEAEEKSRQRSWMPHPITGYYLPEDHFGDKDIPQLRESRTKYNPLPSSPQN